MILEISLKNNNRRLDPINLSAIPRRGDILSYADPKKPRYLVLRVEFFIDSDMPTLHIKEFPNEISITSHIKEIDN